MKFVGLVVLASFCGAQAFFTQPTCSRIRMAYESQMDRKQFVAGLLSSAAVFASSTGAANAVGALGNRPMMSEEKDTASKLEEKLQRKAPPAAPTQPKSKSAPAPAPAPLVLEISGETESGHRRRAMVACKDAEAIKTVYSKTARGGGKQHCVQDVLNGDYAILGE